MAVVGKQVVVPATAGGIRLDTADLGAERIYVRNVGATTVFVGGVGVTAATGYALVADSEVTLDLREGDQLWAIVAAGTKTVSVLESGV